MTAGTVLLPGCSASTEAPVVDNQTAGSPSDDPMANRTIIDDAGRAVSVPGLGALNKIYFTSSTAEIYCYTLAPDLAAGTTYQWTQQELAYLDPVEATLPYLGSTSGGQQLNPEAILGAGVQLLVDVANDAPTQTDISQADDLQEQTGIPVVLYNGALSATANTYRELGTLLGRESQAEQLAEYCENTLQDVQTAVAQVPNDQRVSLYYAEGPDGLSTEPADSTHAQTFQIAGANNVASVAAVSGKGMSSVSMEQVLAWNPQVIIAWSTSIQGGASDTIPTSPDWSTITAVQTGRVYTMPNAPFAWCDRPSTLNRILGIQWVANMLYPSAYNVNMLQVTQQFYNLFYHVTLTDAQAQDLLGNSYPAYQG
jgi:iron complex transport system substrate-binding protein